LETRVPHVDTVTEQVVTVGGAGVGGVFTDGLAVEFVVAAPFGTAVGVERLVTGGGGVGVFVGVDEAIQVAMLPLIMEIKITYKSVCFM
jgi:hypothetical protein